MRRTKEEAALTRKQLLKAALHIFREKGYTATTLEDIAQATGMTRGAVYWHFGSKADLFNTMIREQYIQANEKLRTISNEGGTPLQIFRRLLVTWMTYVEEDAEFRTMMEIVAWKVDAISEMTEGFQEKVEGTRASIQHFSNLLRQGMACGEVRLDVQPEVAAATAIALIHGTTSTWLLDPSIFPLKTYAEGAVDIFIRGLSRT